MSIFLRENIDRNVAEIERHEGNHPLDLKICVAVIKEKGILQATFNYVVKKSQVFLKWI